MHEPDVAALLADAVEAQVAADASWAEVQAAMDRHRPIGVAAIQAWRDACDASGMEPLMFGARFLNLMEQTRAAQGDDDGR